MTVCIAAICDGSRAAIMIADRRIGMGFVEGDLGFKMSWICPTWRVLLAGNDFAAAAEIARRVRRRLVLIARRDPSVPADIVQSALASAYQEVRLNRIEARYLRSRGWTVEEFKEKGHRLLSPVVYAEIDSAMKGFDLEVDLIACGFENQFAGLIRVKNPGEATIETDSWFEVIGSGDALAFASLYRRSYSDNMPVGVALYYLYEAKIAAERASGVGEPSNVMIMRRGKRGLDEYIIPSEVHGDIRTICDDLNPKDLSAAHLQTMDSVLRRALSLRRPLPKSSGQGGKR